MSKFYIVVFATSALLFSCSRETVVDDILPGQTITFTAGWAESNVTRTILQSDGTSVWWEAGAQINVFFSDKASGRFISTNSQPQDIVDFQGSLPVVVGSVETDTPAHAYWAIYPYDAANTCDGESVTLTVPSTQTATEGTFANKLFPSIATSTNFHLAFYNVCGGVRFSVANEGIKSITFKSNNGEPLVGKAQVEFDGVPVVKTIIEGVSEVIVNSPEGGFVPGEYYFATLLPQSLSQGISLTFRKSDGKVASTSFDNNITINRSRFGKMDEKDKGLEFKDDGSVHDPTEFIVFEDIIAKYACLDRFDSNNDGEVSYAEAAAATSLSGLFANWNTVKSFDEIQYFTGVSSISGVFTGCSKLTHITIPDWITALGDKTFRGCSSLERVVLPADLTSIPDYCFYDCGSLTDVTLPRAITSIPKYCFHNCRTLTTLSLPSTIESLGQYAFSYCEQLASLELPSGLHTVGDYAFQYCKTLTSIVFPRSVTTLGKNTFYYCSNLTSVVLPDNLSAIPNNCFQQCSALAMVIWPQALKSIGDSAFAGCRFQDADFTVILPSSVTTIGNGAFGYVHQIVIPSTSPVLCSSYSFIQNYTFLYVPDNMVELYKVRTNWSNYADHIRPISDYPSPFTVSLAVGEAIDLGLSVKWSSWNLGASAPEDFGHNHFFAWGETEPNLWDGFSWSYYKWCNDYYYDDLTKYNVLENYGIVDNKTTLDPEDDAAHVNWGGTWRIPTREEFQELLNNCTKEFVKENDVRGYRFTSKMDGYSDKSIFLPAIEYIISGSINGSGSFMSGGGYWSSSLNTSRPSTAHGLSLSSSSATVSTFDRCSGLTIRPVCD